MAIMDRSMEGKRQYTTGISKGVFFGEDGKAFPWNGLISVTEKPQANAPTPVYNSLGEKYDQFGNIAEKKHSLTCYTYPEEMDEFLGIEYLEAMGYSVDERPPKKFSMAYRTELGDGLYEIHVLLNQIATFADTAKNTITNNITPTVVTMNLEGVPDPRIKTSHIILDSRLPLTASAERLLFGNNLIDGNINEFLDAEPTWVTVATNYAPIIEPDYDNMVWLGGMNVARYRDPVYSNNNVQVLPTDGYFTTGAPIFKHTQLTTSSQPTRMTEPIRVSPGETYTFSIWFYKLSPEASPYCLMYNTTDGRSEGSLRHPNPPVGEWYRSQSSYTNTEADDKTIQFYMYANNSPSGSETLFTSPKVEAGSLATAWTPNTDDSFVIPEGVPRPDNYVPGVKGGAWWDSRRASIWNSLAYYDETYGGLGLYSLSYATIGQQPASIVLRNALTKELPRSRFSTTITMPEVLNPLRDGESRAAEVSLFAPFATTYAPNTIGSRHVAVEHTYAGSGDEYARIRSHALQGGGIIVANDLLWTDASYTGGFFDAYTKPKSKGERYVRVQNPDRNDHQYTIHQQLVLQSKSRVILSDITPNQYTLEASDSQLRVDGQTFTFKGPQATPIGDDQFTIDDTVYGED